VIAKCYKTRFITTVPFVRHPEAIHVDFRPEAADERAQEIVRHGIAAYKDRKTAGIRVRIPDVSSKLLTGISVEALVSVLSTVDAKDPLKPVIDADRGRDILGRWGWSGARTRSCGTGRCPRRWPRAPPEQRPHRDDGCVNHILAQGGFLTSEATERYAGPRLKKVLTAIGNAAGLGAPLPPVLHMGSCVDNSRIYDLLAALAGKLGVEVSQLPVAGSAPEFITEKAILDRLLLPGPPGSWSTWRPAPRVFGSPFAVSLLTEKLPGLNGGKVLVAATPDAAVSGSSPTSGRSGRRWAFRRPDRNGRIDGTGSDRRERLRRRTRGRGPRRPRPLRGAPRLRRSVSRLLPAPPSRSRGGRAGPGGSFPPAGGWKRPGVGARPGIAVSASFPGRGRRSFRTGRRSSSPRR